MIVLEFDGVEVDRCSGCGGTWLDAGELELIAARAGVPADRVLEALATARERGRSRRRCLRCPRRLREIAVGAGPEVHLDRCPWGHGLWCDRGEMVSVVRSLAGDGPVARFFADLYRSEIEPLEKGE